MSHDRFLQIYLNDHLAGSMAGIELIKRSAANNEGTPLGDFWKGLEAEVDSDRAALLEILAAVGGQPDRLKEGTAWIAEKVGRLKMNGQLVGYSDLSRLIELEGMGVGLDAKMALWEALRRLAARDDRLDAVMIDELIERCTRQRQELERFRLAAADTAFTGEDMPAESQATL
ncbi:MAG: hypothetical protein M3345_05505 [Actinomycetota bacterium]|nr:hypothetical protein [Actinomycetota bacterium]